MFRSARGLNYARSLVARAIQPTRNITRFAQRRNHRVEFNLMGLALVGAGVYFAQKITRVEAEEQVAVPMGEITQPEVQTIEPNDDHRYVLKENPLRELLKDKPKEQFDITLYQYHVCPFCCKVRAFLDFNKIPYKIVEVNPITKSEIKFSNYKKVPVLIVEGQQMNDSSVIISSLSEILENKDSGKRDSREIEWRKWVDHKFVHMIPPNIYRTLREADAAFEYISDMNSFSWLQRVTGKYAGSVAMFAVSKKLKKRHGIVDEREEIYACAREWANEVGDKPFHGGEKPNLADLAVYGVMSSIEGLPTFHDIVENTPIGPWYERTKNVVGVSTGKK
jgi:microsomal prostaglandin-E synthase 2